MRTSMHRSDWQWIQGLCEHICLCVGGWVFITKAVLFILIILRFMFLSLPPSPHFSWDTTCSCSLPVPSHWTHSLAAAQLEVRKQYVKVCTMFRLKPFSWSMLHSMFTLSPTPLPSYVVCVQYFCIPLCNKNGNKRTLFYLFFSSSFIKHISHSLRNDTFFITSTPLSLTLLLAIL